MQDGRSTGFILMGLAVAAFLGSTAELLPPVTCFPALALFAVGAVRFLRSSREALAEADRRTQARLHPTIRENRSTQAQAERRAQRRGAALSSINGPDVPDGRAADRVQGGFAADASGRASAARAGRPAAATWQGPGRGVQSVVEEIELCDVQEDELQVTPDVSFPVEIQRGDALADQLRKLNQLLMQGILTEEEYAIAKAKLLG